MGLWVLLELWLLMGLRVPVRLWGAQLAPQGWVGARNGTGWQGYRHAGSPAALPRLQGHPKMCRETQWGTVDRRGWRGDVGWGPPSRGRVGTEAVLPPMCLGPVSPMGAEVARFWAVRIGGAAGVLGHPVVGAGWGRLFALGVFPPT